MGRYQTKGARQGKFGRRTRREEDWSKWVMGYRYQNRNQESEPGIGCMLTNANNRKQLLCITAPSLTCRAGSMRQWLNCREQYCRGLGNNKARMDRHNRACARNRLWACFFGSGYYVFDIQWHGILELVVTREALYYWRLCGRECALPARGAFSLPHFHG